MRPSSGQWKGWPSKKPRPGGGGALRPSVDGKPERHPLRLTRKPTESAATSQRWLQIGKRSVGQVGPRLASGVRLVCDEELLSVPICVEPLEAAVVTAQHRRRRTRASGPVRDRVTDWLAELLIIGLKGSSPSADPQPTWPGHRPAAPRVRRRRWSRRGVFPWRSIGPGGAPRSP